MTKDKYFRSNLAESFLAPLQNLDEKSKIKDLWQIGELPKLDENGMRPKTIGIVGSRRCTNYGRSVAQFVARSLATEGVVVVSGIAYGIDTAAHQGCLDADGITIAVLGTPIDHIYPQENYALSRRILKRGAILSEYSPSSPVRNYHFLERNRIVAALSDVLLIAEASDHSGSLKTAAYALDLGKDVFVVPGDITRPMSTGCNRLLRDGASAYTELDDLLRVLFPRRPPKKQNLEKLTGPEFKVVKQIKNGVEDGETIIKNLAISASLFNQTITMLEIKGLISALGANRWALC